MLRTLCGRMAAARLSLRPHIARNGRNNSLIRAFSLPPHFFSRSIQSALGRNTLKSLRTAKNKKSKRNFSAKDGAPNKNSREQHALQMYKAKENVTTAFTLTAMIAVCGVGVVAAYLIVKQLFPSVTSPNSVFSKSLEAVQKDEKVKSVFGTPIKGFGKDFGGHRVGRRNFIENISYVDDEGIEHCRIVFNIEGSRGRGCVWADRSSANTEGQFYYLVVQDLRSKEIWAIVDNRPVTPEAQRQEQVASLLNKKGVVLYGSPNCQFTKIQFQMFGVNASKQLHFVNCEDNMQKCIDAQIDKLPTWDFGDGVKIGGVKTIEDLDVLAKKKKEK